MKKLLIILLCFVFLGFDFPQQKNRLTEANRRFELSKFPSVHRGFTIQKPKDARWYSDPEQQQPHSAVLDIPALSDSHTVYATVASSLAPVGVTNLQQLKTVVDNEWKNVPPTHQMLKHESSLATYKGIPCVKYSVKVLDKEPKSYKTSLIMTFEGFVVFVTSEKNFVVDISYSERGKEEEVGKETAGLKEDFFSIVTVHKKQ